MSFQWSDFCDIAIFLRDNAADSAISEEAAFRSAVSRAYYSAFKHALNHAKDNGDYSEPQDVNTHYNIRDYYQQRGMVQISKQLGRLHIWRKEADYDDAAYRINLQLVNIAITEAQKILKLP